MKVRGFAQIPNNILWDSQLSLQAKGLWAYIKSKPPNWDFSCARIAQETKEGRKSILKAMKELEQAGYLHRTKLPSGRVVHKIHPQIYKAPLSYEPPISFQDCREAIQSSTGMSDKEAKQSTQQLVSLCQEAQIKRSHTALKSWIHHHTQSPL